MASLIHAFTNFRQLRPLFAPLAKRYMQKDCSTRFYGSFQCRNIHVSTRKSSLLAVNQENVEYPPVTPRWPPGWWGELNEEKAWEFYEKAAEIEDTRCLWDKLNKLTNETFHFFKIDPFSENPPPRRLPYQQYLTKTHLVINELPEIYKDIDVDADLEFIKSIVMETLINEKQLMMDKFKLLCDNPTLDITPERIEQETSEQLISAVCDVIISYLGRKYEHLLFSQRDLKPHHAAFWCSGGLREECKGRTDDEFIYLQYENQPTLSIRVDNPLPVMASLDNEICRYPNTPSEWHHIPDVYEIKGKEHKGIYNAGFLTKSPFNDGNPAEFGQVLVNTICPINKLRSEYSDKDVSDIAIGCGLLSGFGWTLTQAYSQGFSWLQDVTYPLTTQTVVFDGMNLTFCAYQLNTIALWKIGVDGVPYNNICWTIPDVPLFSKITDNSVEGLNDDALRTLIKFLVLKPQDREIEMRPYLNESPKDIESFMNCVSEPIIEQPLPPRLYAKSKDVKLVSPVVVTAERVDKAWRRAEQYWNEKTGRFE